MSHALGLIDDARKLGIALSASGEARIRYRPQHLLPPALLAQIKAHRDLVLMALAFVPTGWDPDRWAARLAYLADICVVPERAAELREWRDRILSEQA
jgi:hypothetical protein